LRKESGRQAAELKRLRGELQRIDLERAVQVELNEGLKAQLQDKEELVNALRILAAGGGGGGGGGSGGAQRHGQENPSAGLLAMQHMGSRTHLLYSPEVAAADEAGAAKGSPYTAPRSPRSPKSPSAARRRDSGHVHASTTSLVSCASVSTMVAGGSIVAVPGGSPGTSVVSASMIPCTPLGSRAGSFVACTMTPVGSLVPALVHMATGATTAEPSSGIGEDRARSGQPLPPHTMRDHRLSGTTTVVVACHQGSRGSAAAPVGSPTPKAANPRNASQSPRRVVRPMTGSAVIQGTPVHGQHHGSARMPGPGAAAVAPTMAAARPVAGSAAILVSACSTPRLQVVASAVAAPWRVGSAPVASVAARMAPAA